MWDNLLELYSTGLTSWLETTLVSQWLYPSDSYLLFIKDSLIYHYSTNYTFVFTLKLAICLVFLSAIRGGVPRYRYDFLTKMGWIKFLGLVLSVFISTYFIVLLW